MPPKPAPKLTKKQLKQLAAAQAKKKQEDDKKRQQQQQQKAKQQRRLNQIEGQKSIIEQRRRVETEKIQFQGTLQQRIKNQQKVLNQLEQEDKWKNSTTQYFKDYSVKGTNLSTLINIFRDQGFQKPQKSLQLCQQAEIISSQLHQQILSYRADSNTQMQSETLKATRQIHKIQMLKLQEIMIAMANEAQQMEQKNNELSRNKGEPNRRVQGRKLLQYIQHMTKNFKIGMFLNSTTTKTVNKFRPIQIKQFGLNTEIPSKWINANSIVKFQWVNFDPFQNDQKQSFHIIGGVYNLQFYQLLMGSKKINNIVLKKLFKGKQILQKFKLQTSLIKQPFQLQYQIPPNVFLHTFDQSSLQFAQYDFSTNKWSTLPYDTVQQYDVNQKKVVLRVARPQPVAYVQSRCHDYPYVSWELRSIHEDKVLLDIQLNRQLPKKNQNDPLQRLILTFQIQDNLVKLLIKDSYPQFRDLCQGQRTPQGILSQLSKRGVHLLPENFDYLQAKVPPKDTDTQKNAVRDIAYAVESFYMRSVFNDSNQIVVKIRENLDNETIFLQDQEKDWKKIHWRNDRCWVSNRKINQKHLNFETLLQKQNFCEKECLQRIQYDKKYLLRKSVMKMLSLTRILSFMSAKQQESRLRQIIKERILVN